MGDEHVARSRMKLVNIKEALLTKEFNARIGLDPPTDREVA